jgi:MFS family permease
VKRIKTIGSVLAFFSRQERPFRVNLFKISIQNFFTSLTQQYQSIYITSLGVTAFQLGVFNSLGGLVGAIMSPPTGWFADKRGIKAVMALGMFPMILGTLFFALAADGIMVIPAVILATLALRIEMTACPMVCGTYLKSEKRAMGMQFCDTLSAVPRLISPIIGAAIVTRFGGMSLSGIRPLYYLQFAGFLLVLLIVLGIFSSPKRGDNKLATSFIGGLREVFKQGPAAKKWIIYSCFSTVPVFVSTTYIPLYAAQVKAVDQFVLSGMATA